MNGGKLRLLSPPPPPPSGEGSQVSVGPDTPAVVLGPAGQQSAPEASPDPLLNLHCREGHWVGMGILAAVWRV